MHLKPFLINFWRIFLNHWQAAAPKSERFLWWFGGTRNRGPSNFNNNLNLYDSPSLKRTNILFFISSFSVLNTNQYQIQLHQQPFQQNKFPLWNNSYRHQFNVRLVSQWQPPNQYHICISINTNVDFTFLFWSFNKSLDSLRLGHITTHKNRHTKL